MKTRNRPFRNWRIEHLEDRRLLTVDVQVLNGDLLVSGTAAGAVEITVQADGSYLVSEGGTSLGTFTGVTDDINVVLDYQAEANDDSVTIDLGGTSADNVRVNLGDGDNSLTIQNGTIGSNLQLRGTAGDDSVTIGADSTQAGPVDVMLGGGANSFTLDGSVEGNLNVVSFNADDVLSVSDTGTVSGITNLGAGEQRSQRCGGRLGSMVTRLWGR